MSTNGTANGPWKGIERPYSGEDVDRLRGTVEIEHTLARLGAERLWELLHAEPYVATLGALTGGQAVQMVKGGLKAHFLRGWQGAAYPIHPGPTCPHPSSHTLNRRP